MNRFIKKFENITSKNILVIGDIMIDEFTYGNVSRISPEAPVPVVQVENEKVEPGGAGNVANNIVSLKANCKIVGIIGNDVEGEILRKHLEQKKINVEGIFIDSTRPTIKKTRIIAGHQQIVRVDKEVKGKISKEVFTKVLEYIKKNINSINAIIISDYGKGLISYNLLKETIALCKKNNCHILVDPKIEHFKNYKNITCMTPNTAEALAGMGVREIKNENELISLGFKILKMLNSECVLITRGEKGMTLFQKNQKYYNIPTVAKEVFDVTGAGDTVISVFALALTVGFNFLEAAKISNYAAGIVVGKLGTTPIYYNELMEVLKKINSKQLL